MLGVKLSMVGKRFFLIDLLNDDLKASITCAKRIVKAEGLKAWYLC